jgi:nucleotide-binding universal stress UspA family protein
MNDNQYGVLLAVGPDGIHDGALDFAAAEALRRDTGVELLHVVHALVTPPSEVGQAESIDRVMSKVGRAVLTEASDTMRHRLGTRAPLSVQLLYGRVAPTIADRAATAELVVLERRAIGAVERSLTMSVSTRVAAHAAAPVVVVPRDWSAADVEERPVTAGVDHPTAALGQVEAAAAYARALHRPLVALHALWLAEPYQNVIFAEHGRGDWVKQATVELERSLSRIGDLGELDLRLDVRWARPTEALVAATRTSSVVVLSRRRPEHVGAHLGPVTRAVLQNADGPVMVVDRTQPISG